ncbi:MAG: hypothetical protein R3A80_11160 [Bdellovibrionota bacterium]
MSFGGSTYWNCNAFIKSFDYVSTNSCLNLYSRAHGTGFSTSRIESIIVSITEAMERLCFYECFSQPELRKKYSFDIDSTTNGLAAHPAALKTAIVNSRAEAEERYLLQLFNLKKLLFVGKREKNSVKYYILKANLESPYYLVIAYFFDSEFSSFGFSSSDSVDTAMEKSKKELIRNYISLVAYNEKKVEIESIFEERLVKFSGSSGRKIFNDLLSGQKLDELPARKDTVVDLPVIESEEKYGFKFYRTLYQPVNDLYDIGNSNMFFF